MGVGGDLVYPVLFPLSQAPNRPPGQAMPPHKNFPTPCFHFLFSLPTLTPTSNSFNLCLHICPAAAGSVFTSLPVGKLTIPL